jgi:hypothetical protein
LVLACLGVVTNSTVVANRERKYDEFGDQGRGVTDGDFSKAQASEMILQSA